MVFLVWVFRRRDATPCPPSPPENESQHIESRPEAVGRAPTGLSRFWLWLKLSASDHWWRMLLLGSGAALVWAAGFAAWGLDVMNPWGGHSDLVWPSFWLGLAVLLVFPVAWKVLNYWSSPGRVLSLLTFMSFAGLAGYLTWRIIDRASPGTTTTFGPFTTTVEATTSDSAIIIALVAATVVALVIALGGSDLIRRVTKVGSGGIELGVWKEAARIPEFLAPPAPRPPDYWGGDCQELKRLELSKPNRWFYDIGTSLVLHMRHEGVNPDELTGADLRRYRRIIYWVGSAALSQDQPDKALDILEAIEHVPNLERDELYAVAIAQLSVAVREETFSGKSEEYMGKIHRAADLLRRALRQDPDHAPSHWHLGYVYDELGFYDRAIKHDKLAIKFDATGYRNLSNWSMAVSFLKQGDKINALAAVGKITACKCWDEIWKDEELASLRDDKQFKKWYRERRSRGS